MILVINLPKGRKSDPAKETKQAEKSLRYPLERSRLSRDERQYDQDLNKALTLSMDPEPKSIMSDNNRISNDRDVPIGVYIWWNESAVIEEMLSLHKLICYSN